MISQIKSYLPYKYNGIDFSSTILLLITIVTGNILLFIRRFLENKISENYQNEYKQWQDKLRTDSARENISPEIKATVSELDNKFQELQTSNKSDRKKLLKEFALLRHKLDSMGQQLAFLSVDVVDSTGMKRNEDKYLAAHDFDRYNELVVACMKQFNVVKYTLTPDGMMSCFRSTDEAVGTARLLIEKLVDFNQHEKKIQRNFAIRCGINSGFVYIDEETPLEQISDRVIDIAGHMQKHAKPNTINIAESAIEPLKARGGFNETANIIDEQRVYEWQLK